MKAQKQKQNHKITINLRVVLPNLPNGMDILWHRQRNAVK